MLWWPSWGKKTTCFFDIAMKNGPFTDFKDDKHNDLPIISMIYRGKIPRTPEIIWATETTFPRRAHFRRRQAHVSSHSHGIHLVRIVYPQTTGILLHGINCILIYIGWQFLASWVSTVCGFGSKLSPPKCMVEYASGAKILWVNRLYQCLDQSTSQTPMVRPGPQNFNLRSWEHLDSNHTSLWTLYTYIYIYIHIYIYGTLQYTTVLHQEIT